MNPDTLAAPAALLPPLTDLAPLALQALLDANYACGHDCGSRILGGVSIVSDGSKLTVAATDGKILFEEVPYLPDLAKHEPFAVVLDVASKVSELRKLLKAIPRKLHATLTIRTNGMHVSVSDGSSFTVKAIDGVFPGYQNAFVGARSDTVPARIGLDPKYLAIVEQIYGPGPCAFDLGGRGVVVTRLAKSSRARRVLIMPVTLPEGF